jgi:hypothetical protein
VVPLIKIRLRKREKAGGRTVGVVLINYTSVDEVFQFVDSGEEFGLDYPCRFVFVSNRDEGGEKSDVDMSTGED